MNDSVNLSVPFPCSAVPLLEETTAHLLFNHKLPHHKINPDAFYLEYPHAVIAIPCKCMLKDTMTPKPERKESHLIFRSPLLFAKKELTRNPWKQCKQNVNAYDFYPSFSFAPLSVVLCWHGKCRNVSLDYGNGHVLLSDGLPIDLVTLN